MPTHALSTAPVKTVIFPGEQRMTSSIDFKHGGGGNKAIFFFSQNSQQKKIASMLGLFFCILRIALEKPRSVQNL